MLGTRQSGVPTLRVANLLRDHALMDTARDEAMRVLEDGAMTEQLLRHLDDGWTVRFGFAEVG